MLRAVIQTMLPEQIAAVEEEVEVEVEVEV